MTKKVIGITGGAGSGKTGVLRIMKEDYHAQIIIADDVARKLSSPGKKSYQRIVETFGKDILLADGPNFESQDEDGQDHCYFPKSGRCFLKTVLTKADFG